MCHHRRRRRPSFLPAEAAARPGTGTVCCVRESVLCGNTTNLSTPMHNCYIHLCSSSLVLPSLLISSPAATQGSSSARPYSILVHLPTHRPSRACRIQLIAHTFTAHRSPYVYPVATPLPTRQGTALTQISTRAASRVHMAWTAAHSSISPILLPQANIPPACYPPRAIDPLIMSAANRTLLEQSIY